MVYKDLFSRNSGLFKDIFFAELKPEYLEIFGDLDPHVLDLHTFHHFGDKPLISKIGEETKKEDVKNIILFYKDIWLTQKELLNLSYDVINKDSETITKTGTITHETNNTNQTVDSVTTFNDNNFKDNGKTNEQVDGRKEETYNLKNTRSGTNYSSDPTADIQKEITFRKQSFYYDVIKDIVKNITKQVY